MADLAFDSQHDEVFFYSSNKVNEKTPKNKRFVFIILAWILTMFLLFEAIYYVFVLPATTVAKLRFIGNSSISSLNLKEIAGLTDQESWAGINTFDVVRKLARCPLIESVSAQKKFPDSVIINIVERKGVAVSFANYNGSTIPVEVDRNGVVFRIGSISKKTLPIISGLAFENPQAGMQVHKNLIPLFTQLGNLQEDFSKLINEVSEITIVEKKYGGFELVVYPVQTPIRVRTNNILTEDVLKYMMLIMDIIKGTDIISDIDEVDIRSGNAVYKKRGANNE